MATRTGETERANDVWAEKVELYFLTALGALLGSVAAAYANVFLVSVLSGVPFGEIIGSENPYVVANGYTYVAGFTEPILTKGLPVFVAFAVWGVRRRQTRLDTASMGWRLGAFSGLIFGVYEAYSKMYALGNNQLDSIFVWQDPSFTIPIGTVIFLHVLWGTFAGLAVGQAYGDDGKVVRREWIALVVGYLGLAVFHGFIYNGYLVQRGHYIEILEWLL